MKKTNELYNETDSDNGTLEIQIEHFEVEECCEDCFYWRWDSNQAYCMLSSHDIANNEDRPFPAWCKLEEIHD